MGALEEHHNPQACSPPAKARILGCYIAGSRSISTAGLPMLRKTAPIGALEGTSYSTSMPSSSDSMRSCPTDIHRCWLRGLCSQAKCSSPLLPAIKRCVP